MMVCYHPKSLDGNARTKTTIEKLLLMKKQHDNMDIEKYIGIKSPEQYCVTKKKELCCYLCFSFSFFFLRVISMKKWYEAFSEYILESDMGFYQQICI